MTLLQELKQKRQRLHWITLWPNIKEETIDQVNAQLADINAQIEMLVGRQTRAKVNLYRIDACSSKPDKDILALCAEYGL